VVVAGKVGHKSLHRHARSKQVVDKGEGQSEVGGGASFGKLVEFVQPDKAELLANKLGANVSA
jgi:hypothetical protein